MRRTLILLMAGAMLLAGASIGLAEEANTAEKADTPTPAQLRAQMHRTMAALIDAHSAEKPDEAAIEKLTDKLQALRKQMWAQRDYQGRQAGQRGLRAAHRPRPRPSLPSRTGNHPGHPGRVKQ